MSKKSQHAVFNGKHLVFGKACVQWLYIKCMSPTQFIMKITQKTVHMNSDEKTIWIDTGTLKC